MKFSQESFADLQERMEQITADFNSDSFKELERMMESDEFKELEERMDAWN